MTIASAGSVDIVQSARDMGDLLKTVTGTAMNLEKKMIGVSVAEQVENSNLGNLVDALA